jgi:integrase
VLTGSRIGEVLALRKSDLTAAGLLIDESAFRCEASYTKRRKVRSAFIPAALRTEIEEWAATVEGDFLFPGASGRLFARNGDVIQGMLHRARTAAQIPDLTFRMCRTTFATLYDGDPRDAQEEPGHSTLDMTMRVYRKSEDARLQADVEDMEARFTGKVVRLAKRESA